MLKDLKTKLISVTMPSEEMVRVSGARNAQDIIIYCARVSNPGNQDKFETGEKLIKYLLDNGHYSPFEMVNLVIEVEAPRTITRQILRHRSCAFQEYSGRYSEFKPEDFMLSETRLQDTRNRQQSVDTDNEELKAWWRNAQIEVLELAYSKYKTALERGMAKELARDVLPEGLTPSVMYIQGSLRSWIHYCDVRCDVTTTQREHVEIANQIYNNILLKEFPVLKGVSEVNTMKTPEPTSEVKKAGFYPKNYSTLIPTDPSDWEGYNGNTRKDGRWDVSPLRHYRHDMPLYIPSGTTAEPRHLKSNSTTGVFDHLRSAIKDGCTTNCRCGKTVVK